MIGHQHVRVDPHPKARGVAAQPVEVGGVVVVAEEAGRAVVAALDDMQRQAGEGDAGAAGHGASVLGVATDGARGRLTATDVRARVSSDGERDYDPNKFFAVPSRLWRPGFDCPEEMKSNLTLMALVASGPDRDHFTEPRSGSSSPDQDAEREERTRFLPVPPFVHQRRIWIPPRG